MSGRRQPQEFIASCVNCRKDPTHLERMREASAPAWGRAIAQAEATELKRLAVTDAAGDAIQSEKAG